MGIPVWRHRSGSFLHDQWVRDPVERIQNEYCWPVCKITVCQIVPCLLAVCAADFSGQTNY